MDLSPKQFQQKVLRWYQQHGRKNLPWQKNKMPYHIWLSEIMLQQTQVNTVVPYFQKFIRQFPSIKKLAAADLDDVLALWSGLGYYARARNLHRAAQIIVQEYRGKLPKNPQALQTLPGIGRSTAGAILAFTDNQSTPILDGNVKRILCRLKAITGRDVKKLWKISENLTPQKNVADYTQAMMDLGATICTRTKPNCIKCPFKKDCRAYLKNQVEKFPQKVKRKKLPVKKVFLLILQNKNGEILLEKRPPSGIWGGLWSLPEFLNEKTLKQFLKKKYKKLKSFRHTFTHFHLDITPVYAKVNTAKKQKFTQWISLKQTKKLGCAKPIRSILNQLI